MKDSHHVARQDRPISSATDDALDRGPFVASLRRALIADEVDQAGLLTGRRATGYVVGLTGKWGLGKSSVLKLLAEELGRLDATIVAEFNPWLFSGRDELLNGFFESLRTAMGKSNTEAARELVKQVDRYWGAINLAGHGLAAVVDFNGGAGAASAWWKGWGARIKAALPGRTVRSPEEERKALEKKLAQVKCAVVVLIDELDRVEDDEVRAVAQLVKAIGDIKGVSYLVAYDQDRVVQALGRGSGDEQRATGANYLEKIIQHPIPLRPIFGEDAAKLLDAALVQHGVDFPDAANDTQRTLYGKILNAVTTPREIKRLVGAYAILEGAVRGEICPYDVLAYCWIHTKAPSVRDTLASRIDEVVSDPSVSEALVRSARHADGTTGDVVSVLGEAAAAHEAILRELFPVFGKSAEGQDGNRLHRRRNLVRMLFLGDPPGIIPNREVERIWSLPAEELKTELANALVTGKLAPLIDRLDDLLPFLPSSEDGKFWVTLSRVLHRDTDWLAGPDGARAVADDAAVALYRLALRDRKETGRFAACLAALVQSQDLIIAPWLLRKHLFAYGLTKVVENERGGGVLKREVVLQLLEEELPRYRSAVVDGTILRRLPNVEAIYVLANSGEWDDELRACLTAQVDGPEAISTLAGLLVPPGYSADRSHLNELFDADVVGARVEQLYAKDQLPSEPWLAESTKRLLTILRGGDPHCEFEEDQEE